MKEVFWALLLICTGAATFVVYDYATYQPEASEEKYFDLFIAERLLKRNSSEDSYLFNSIWGGTILNENTVWDTVAEAEQRPLRWIFSKEEFERLDTVSLALKNISGERFYYMTWGYPFSRFRKNLIVYKNGKAKDIPFRGFGCGTGIHLVALNDQETISRRILHPLLFNPYIGEELPLKSEKFPKLFKELYGDSTTIYYEQATYGNPWGKYPSQKIRSSSITVSTDKVLANWKKGIHTKLAAFEEEQEGAFYTGDE